MLWSNPPNFFIHLLSASSPACPNGVWPKSCAKLSDSDKSSFKLKDLNNIPILNKIISKHEKKIKKYSIDLIVRQIIREIINEMVSDVIKTTQRNIKLNNIRSLKDVYNSKNKIVCFSNKMNNFEKKNKNVFKTKNVLS